MVSRMGCQLSRPADRCRYPTKMTQLRELEIHYFTIGQTSIGQTRVLREDFYPRLGSFELVETRWWVESNSTRQSTSVDNIRNLIKSNTIADAIGLAKFLADTNDFGQVISDGYTRWVDFQSMFGREQKTVFPAIESGELTFVTCKGFGTPLPDEYEFSDVCCNMTTLDMTQNLIWRGNHRDIKYTVEDFG